MGSQPELTKENGYKKEFFHLSLLDLSTLTGNGLGAGAGPSSNADDCYKPPMSNVKLKYFEQRQKNKLLSAKQTILMILPLHAQSSGWRHCPVL